jgi:hypothetical protein
MPLVNVLTPDCQKGKRGTGEYFEVMIDMQRTTNSVILTEPDFDPCLENFL